MLFKNSKINVQDIANRISVLRHYLTEVLNPHMNTSFQDIINKYRVEVFIKCQADQRYTYYTLMEIAQELGFSSKTTFNTVFKKYTGMTPSAYKRKLSN